MKNIKILLIVPLLLTCFIRGMDAHQKQAVPEEAGARSIDTNILSIAALVASSTGKKIKITGTSKATSFYYPSPAYNTQYPAEWQHTYTISVIDKKVTKTKHKSKKKSKVDSDKPPRSKNTKTKKISKKKKNSDSVELLQKQSTNLRKK